MKLQLVEDWKDAWKWVSTQSLALSIALITTWLAIPDDLRTRAPDWLIFVLLLVIGVTGFFGRVIQQSTSKKPAPKKKKVK